MGLLNTQTANQPTKGIAGQNYTVGVVQRQRGGRSNVSVRLVNRVGPGSVPELRYTRVLGTEYNLQTEDNPWSGKVFCQVMTDVQFNNQTNNTNVNARLQWRGGHSPDCYRW